MVYSLYEENKSKICLHCKHAQARARFTAFYAYLCAPHISCSGIYIIEDKNVKYSADKHLHW